MRVRVSDDSVGRSVDRSVGRSDIAIVIAIVVVAQNFEARILSVVSDQKSGSVGRSVLIGRSVGRPVLTGCWLVGSSVNHRSMNV